MRVYQVRENQKESWRSGLQITTPGRLRNGTRDEQKNPRRPSPWRRGGFTNRKPLTRLETHAGGQHLAEGAGLHPDGLVSISKNDDGREIPSRKRKISSRCLPFNFAADFGQ